MPLTAQQILNIKCIQSPETEDLISRNLLGKTSLNRIKANDFDKSESLRFVSLEINKTGITVVI